MEWYKVIDTDNFGGDYPDEKQVVTVQGLTKKEAEAIANCFNEVLSGPHASRYYRAVHKDYVLQPGFEP